MASHISSLLFVSAATPTRFEKALATPADIVCLDLEDSVALESKDQARTDAIHALSHPARLALRINALGTVDGLRDLIAVASTGVRPELLLVPKVTAPEEIAVVRASTGDIPLVPLIETPLGLARVAEIARAPGVAAVMFGGGDMAAELGVEIAWHPLLGARQTFLLGCAAAGRPAIDVPYITLGDAEGLAEETRRARALGFQAKAAIHPEQVAVINRELKPGSALINEARSAKTAFDAAGGRAIRHNGQMLEEPVMRRYRRILAQADLMRSVGNA